MLIDIHVALEIDCFLYYLLWSLRVNWTVETSWLCRNTVLLRDLWL